MFAFFIDFLHNPCYNEQRKTPPYMLENMALVSLPDTVNVGLCGKAILGEMKSRYVVYCQYLQARDPQVLCFLSYSRRFI